MEIIYYYKPQVDHLLFLLVAHFTGKISISFSYCGREFDMETNISS